MAAFLARKFGALLVAPPPCELLVSLLAACAAVRCGGGGGGGGDVSAEGVLRRAGSLAKEGRSLKEEGKRTPGDPVSCRQGAIRRSAPRC